MSVVTLTLQSLDHWTHSRHHKPECKRQPGRESRTGLCQGATCWACSCQLQASKLRRDLNDIKLDLHILLEGGSAHYLPHHHSADPDLYLQAIQQPMHTCCNTRYTPFRGPLTVQPGKLLSSVLLSIKPEIQKAHASICTEPTTGSRLNCARLKLCL